MRFFTYSVAIGCLLLITACSESKYSSDQNTSITCDMEEISGDRYYSNGNYFDKGHTQSDECAHSGKFSCKVDSSQQFGLDFNIQDIKKGEHVNITIWRKSEQDLGYIALIDEDRNILVSQGIPIQIENDWQLLNIDYSAEKDFDHLGIYVYNSRAIPTYFDDLEIKRFPTKPLPSVDEQTIKIELSEENLATLKRYRNEAVAQEVIGSKQKKYVDGNLVYGQQSIPISIRLKGDWTDHLNGEKWSFRIKVKGNNSFNNYKSFSIQSPHTRSFLREWVMHKLFEKEDVLTTRYSFSTVTLNGKNLGIYAVEEHFDKQLIESKQRREGPIVKYDEAGFWDVNLNYMKNQTYLNVPFYEAAKVIPFKKKRTKRSKTLWNNFENAEKLMLSFKAFDKHLEDIFDLEQLAKFYAICDIGNISHSLTWHNMRMYYNPVIDKLEIIAYDCYTEKMFEKKRSPIYGYTPKDTSKHTVDFFTYQVFNHPVFREHYIKWLQTFTKEDYLSSFFNDLQAEIDALSDFMQFEFPNYSFNNEFFFDNAKLITDELDNFINKPCTYTLVPNTYEPYQDEIYFPNVGLEAAAIVSAAQKEVVLSNYHTSDITITGYSPDGNNIEKISPYVLKGYHSHGEKHLITVPSEIDYVHFTLAAFKDSVFKVEITKWKSSISIVEDSSISHTTELPYSVKIDEENKTITFTDRRYQFKENLILPVGYSVNIFAGTVFDLINQAAIISHSPFHCLGTKQDSIRFISSDNTGQGLVLLNHYEPSTFEYVRFDGLTSLSEHNWNLTGAVTLYQSTATLSNCAFTNNQSEDALNLIRSEFVLENILINNASSDGLDTDFCSGEIHNSQFMSSFNDCLDFSGSNITISNCAIEQAGDKAISGGESSLINIDNCIIKNSNIGIAAKDGSSIHVDHTQLEGVNCAYAAYRKKPEYTGAHIEISSGTEQNIQKLMLIDAGSSIKYKDELHSSDQLVNVDSIYAPWKVLKQ